MGGLKLGKEAQAKFDEARQKADYSGYLEKKGAKRKNWNNRWFVLKDNYLFYCKTPKSNPQGIINLHACTVSKTEGPTARPYSYSLLAPKSVSIDAKWTNRTYFMAAKSEEDRDNWMRVLEESGKKAVERAAQAKKDREMKDRESKGQPAAAQKAEQTKSKDSDSEDDKPAKKGTETPSSSSESDKESKSPPKVAEQKETQKKDQSSSEEEKSDSEKEEQKQEEKKEEKQEEKQLEEEVEIVEQKVAKKEKKSKKEKKQKKDSDEDDD